jgi:hypothetical protein
LHRPTRCTEGGAEAEMRPAVQLPLLRHPRQGWSGKLCRVLGREAIGAAEQVAAAIAGS